MSIPDKCTVLVVGGGPGGSYTASVLAREGVDTVLLEADTFPRYHIGESMLPSFRHYLRFIDLEQEFLDYGFVKKPGAAFKLRPNHRDGFTDFGVDCFTFNVIRSISDEKMLRHAGKCGAKIFEGIKVNSVDFDSSNGYSNGTNGSDVKPSPGRPVSASYTRKADGATGVIKFDYIVDASGRNGLLNTKYLKNRTYNQGLKNVANWAYYKGCKRYGEGTHQQNAPFFEALRDESGWAWFIPLHDGTTSVGVVMNQEKATKRKATYASSQEFYIDSLKLAPYLTELLGNGELVSAVKSASDYSYHSDSYSFPYARIVGDSGCFIDPFFSSGVHLALSGGLSAAATICAAIKGDCDEKVAADWHSAKVGEGYARFLLVVLSAYKQMQNQDNHVLSDFGEDNFDRAFDFFKPVIQGTADATNKFTQQEFSQTINFLTQAFLPPEYADATEAANAKARYDSLAPEEKEGLKALRTHHIQNVLGLEKFTTDVVDGRVPRLETGKLTLVLVTA